jgi:hypothetical protein
MMPELPTISGSGVGEDKFHSGFCNIVLYMVLSYSLWTCVVIIVILFWG